jgi:hypothetical protein
MLVLISICMAHSTPSTDTLTQGDLDDFDDFDDFGDVEELDLDGDGDKPSKGLISDAASNYEVPYLEARQLSVQGQDLFLLDATGGSVNELGIHLGSTYSQFVQSPMQNRSISNQVDILGETVEGILNVGLTEVFGASFLQYFKSSREGFGSGGIEIETTKTGDGDPATSLHTELGAGYGRIVDARTIAQAAAMYDVVKVKPTERELLDLAEVIGQRSQFSIKYRFEAEKYFYKAISKTMGGLNSAGTFAVRQVLESPLYNVGARRVGWTAGAYTETSWTSAEGAMEGDDIPLKQFYRYATLLDANTGLLFSQELNITNTTGEGDSSAELVLSAGVNQDHSSSWQSQAEAVFSTSLSDSSGSLSISGESNAAFGKNFVGTIGLEISKDMGAAPANLKAYSNFTYYVF